MYREKLFDKYIERIEKRDGRLVLYEGQYKTLVTAQTDCLIPFPDNLCQTPEEKLSVLAHLSCDDASAWLHDILKYILVGKSTEVQGLGLDWELPTNDTTQSIPKPKQHADNT